MFRMMVQDSSCKHLLLLSKKVRSRFIIGGKLCFINYGVMFKDAENNLISNKLFCVSTEDSLLLILRFISLLYNAWLNSDLICE